MNKKRQDERVLVKDDGDLFQLIRRLTAEQPPIEAWDILQEQEPLVQVELPFSVLLKAVDRLSVDEARLLHRRLEDRLTSAMTSSS
jgi:hypothetical protein